MRYERPDVTTLDAPSILEAMGPAQAGYTGANPKPQSGFDSSNRLRNGKL
jgi:hypothetical protein